MEVVMEKSRKSNLAELVVVGFFLLLFFMYLANHSDKNSLFSQFTSEFISELSGIWNSAELVKILLVICCLLSLFTLIYVMEGWEKTQATLSKIAESKRLSTIFSIEGKKVKSVPEDFEPNRERILKSMINTMEDARERYENGKGSVDTWAVIILNYSGFDAFVSRETVEGSKKALIRLLSNGDMEKVKVFLTDIVNQL
jgi:hypothetical protein